MIDEWYIRILFDKSQNVGKWTTNLVLLLAIRRATLKHKIVKRAEGICILQLTRWFQRMIKLEIKTESTYNSQHNKEIIS